MIEKWPTLIKFTVQSAPASLQPREGQGNWMEGGREGALMGGVEGWNKTFEAKSK